MTKYLSCDGSVELTYLNGLLQSILLITEDLVTFDGLNTSFNFMRMILIDGSSLIRSLKL